MTLFVHYLIACGAFFPIEFIIDLILIIKYKKISNELKAVKAEKEKLELEQLQELLDGKE